MSKELDILQLADDYEKVTYKDAQAYLIINKKIKEYNCLFGFIDFPDDYETAKGLFDLLERKALERGYHHLVGPVNYCTWMSYRWTISNFDCKLYPDCTNPAYYPQTVERLGYRQLYTYRSAVVNTNNPLYALGEVILKQKQKEGFVFRLFEREEMYAMAREVYDVSIDAFRGSYLYSEIPFEAFKEGYLSWTYGLESAMFIAYDGDTPVGYVYGYKNPYGDQFIAKTTAVKKEYQKNKLYVALLYLGCNYVKEQGYDETVYHFQNEQKDTFKRYDGDVESNEKRYAVYIKEF